MVTVFCALNSRKLDRMKQDLPIYVLGLAAFVALHVVLNQLFPSVDGSFAGWAERRRESLAVRFGPRILAIGLWAGYFQLHRSYHRAMDVAGMDPESPWKAVAVSWLIASVIGIALGMLSLQISSVLTG